METKSGYEEIYESFVNTISAEARVHHNVRMGRGNVIMEGVIIRDGVEIGNDNYFGPYSIIGDLPEKHGYFNKIGKVSIGNNNRFTKQVTIDSSTDSTTVICNNVIILKNGHIGHDAKIGSNVIISCNVCIGGHTTVGDDCNFGLGSVVHQRLNIPPKVMIGMNTTITKKTIMFPGRKLVGSPARDIGPNER